MFATYSSWRLCRGGRGRDLAFLLLRHRGRRDGIALATIALGRSIIADQWHCNCVDALCANSRFSRNRILHQAKSRKKENKRMHGEWNDRTTMTENL